MSHAWGAVKFEDGTIKHYEYNGNADIVCTRLYNSIEGVNENWRSKNMSKCVCGKDESVVIYSDYGGGFYWNGRACKHCNAITDGLYPYNDDVDANIISMQATEQDYKKSLLATNLKHGKPNWI